MGNIFYPYILAGERSGTFRDSVPPDTCHMSPDTWHLPPATTPLDVAKTRIMLAQVLIQALTPKHLDLQMYWNPLGMLVPRPGVRRPPWAHWGSSGNMCVCYPAGFSLPRTKFMLATGLGHFSFCFQEFSTFFAEWMEKWHAFCCVLFVVCFLF